VNSDFIASPFPLFMELPLVLAPVPYPSSCQVRWLRPAARTGVEGDDRFFKVRDSEGAGDASRDEHDEVSKLSGSSETGAGSLLFFGCAAREFD
jgi:hypothetical protein